MNYEEAALRNWATESQSAESQSAESPSAKSLLAMKSDLLRALEHMNAIVLVQSDQVT